MKKKISLVLLIAMMIGALSCLHMTGFALEEPTEKTSAETVLYEQTFDGLTAGSYTKDQLIQLLNLKGIGETPGTQYEITADGKLHIYVPYQNPDFPENHMSGQTLLDLKNFGNLQGKRIVLEYERTYNESKTHCSFYSGIGFFKDGNNFVEPINTVEGFFWNRVRIGNPSNSKESKWMLLVAQGRPEQIAFQRHIGNYKTSTETKYQGYQVGDNYGTPSGSNNTVFGSTDRFRVVIDPINGIDVYVNDVLASTSKTDYNWKDIYSKTMGGNMRLRVMPGVDVVYDNIKVTTGETPVPELIVTEFNPAGTAGWDEYLEIYNNSSKPVNFFDYYIIRDGKLDGGNAAWDTKQRFDFYPGTHTFVQEGKPSITTTSHNPSYEEGVLMPGEVAVIWSMTDTYTGMRNEGKTVEDFRKSYQLPASVKVFSGHQNVPIAFNNGGGPYRYAVMPKTVDVTEQHCKWDHLLGNAASFFDHVNATKSPVVVVSGAYGYDTVLPLSTFNGNGSLELKYLENNHSRHGYLLSSVKDQRSIGVVKEEQKRKLDVILNGKAIGTVALGEALDYSRLNLEGKQILSVTSNGKTAYGQQLAIDAVVDTVEIVAVELVTLQGAAVRTEVPTGLRWQTAVNRSDFDYLSGLDSVKSVAIGTLITPTQHVVDAGTFTREAIDAKNFKDGGYLDVQATPGAWYQSNAEHDIFAGSVINILPENYNLQFSAVGYLTVTFRSGETVTVYGEYHQEFHSRSVSYVAKMALEDTNSGLTDQQKANIKPFADAYLPNN